MYARINSSTFWLTVMPSSSSRFLNSNFKSAGIMEFN